ncbi:MAG TPA: C4-type zinc ribbon domain-containing protein [Candidatus Omnitrophota bacterium]|nr:C4-type zinc ribbon domain-containing protein [Candidatus Omnitrophota bacterium]HPT38936.1 C4-type zinc ribbon domain-containing protein [Candidatus Omnitrophota bacterium]
MPNVDLKAQITGLVKLQELDSEIYALGNEKNNKPQEIKILEAAFELKKQDLLALEKKSLDLQKQRKEKELELAANAEGIKKLSGQLFSLKTNKEFQTMQQQIADAKADGSVIEEKILISFEESDKIKAQIDAENLKLKDEEKIFLQKKKSVETRIEEIAGRISQLDAQRKQVIPGIDPKMLQEYERILHSRDGLAIVPVKDNSCGGCHMLVPPQVINLIKMYERIVTCEVCNRILYIQE